MRGILFRGKRIDNGEWIFGYYFQKKNMLSEDGLPVTHCISDDPPFGAEVEPKTVGQYTGMADKSGDKIFEGDILELDGEEEFFEVGYETNAAKFVIIGDIDMFYFDNVWTSEIKIVGNIHDDPELVGGSEE